MTFDYSRAQATAERLIARFGRSGAIRRKATSDSAGTPWDPSDDTITTTDHACTLVVTDYTLRERESTLIGTTDRRVLISTEGLTITPAASDLLVIDGTPHEIQRIAPVQPGDTVVVYDAQVRF